MSDSGILSQVVKIEKTNKKLATHFALCNGSQFRYLIDLKGGKTRLSGNISTYSRKLRLLMQFIGVSPLFLFKWLRLGYFVKANLHPEVEKCRKDTKKESWNMIIGTYDEKQKLVLQCFNHDEEADFIKIGNALTEDEMNAEITFLNTRKKYLTFEIPELVDTKRRADGSTFNIQVTKEFCGSKVEPVLSQDIIAIYKELSKDKECDLEFSHGDFAPWNLKKDKSRYTLFDWEHCGYRMKGFDIMHYATIIEAVINGKCFSDAFDSGLNNIRKFIPDFEIDKAEFLKEFMKLRTQIAK